MPDLAQQIRDRLDLTGAHDRRVAIRAVLDRHKQIPIYDECGHQHTDGDPDTVFVEDLGTVCADGLAYIACDECCRDNGYVTEHCATGHRRDLVPCWPCPTTVDIAAALGIEVPA